MMMTSQKCEKQDMTTLSNNIGRGWFGVGEIMIHVHVHVCTLKTCGLDNEFNKCNVTVKLIM